MTKVKKATGLHGRPSDAPAVFGCTPTPDKNRCEESPPLVTWEPLVDITEDEREFLIMVGLSEVAKERLNVVVENGILTVSGERNFVMGEEPMKYHLINLVHDLFALTFMLPGHADVGRMTSEFEQDLLKVRLPKKEDAKLERIEVLAG